MIVNKAFYTHQHHTTPQTNTIDFARRNDFR